MNKNLKNITLGRENRKKKKRKYLKAISLVSIDDMKTKKKHESVLLI